MITRVLHELEERAQRHRDRESACARCLGAGAWTLDEGNVPCPDCGAQWRPGAGVPLDLTGLVLER